MAKDRICGVKISGISACVPQNIVKIDDFIPQMGEKEVKKFKRMAGVIQKHCCTDDNIITASDLCCAAAERLFTETNSDREGIDVLLFVTQTPDYYIPSTAYVLQSRLGLGTECMAYDINLGCSGYVYGMHVAASYLQSENIRKVLLLVGDTNVRCAPVTHRLYGESGSATLLEKTGENCKMDFSLHTRGDKFADMIMFLGGARHKIKKIYDTFEGFCGERWVGGYSDEMSVFRFGVGNVVDYMNEFIEYFGYDRSEFGNVFLQQSSLMAIREMIRKMKFDEDRCPISITKYGNAPCAGMPLALCDFYGDNVNTGKNDIRRVLVCGFGMGLSAGIASFDIDVSKCFSVDTINEGWDDGVLKKYSLG